MVTVVFVLAATATVAGSKRVALIGVCVAVVQGLLVASVTSFFVEDHFVGGSVELTEEISGSSSSSDLLQKVLVLVGNSSGNGCIVMLGLAVHSTTFLT